MTATSGTDPEGSVFQPDVLETARLAALRRYDVLDTPPEEAFDRLTTLAADFFDVEVAFVAFLDADRQWFKSSVGFDRNESSLAASFCTFTIQSEGLHVIEDATQDDRVAESPFVTEEGLRFYAGVPLVTPDGHPIGTFSIMDFEPRSLSDEEARRLETLAEMAMDELELRRKTRQYREAARRFEAVLEDPSMLAGVLAPDGTLQQINETALGYVEASREALLGRAFWDTPWVPDGMQEEIRDWIEEAAGGAYVERKVDLTRPNGAPYSIEGTIRPVTDEAGEVTALVVSAHDITERKQKERKLRESEARYRALAEHFPDGAVGVYDEDLRYTLAEGTMLGTALPSADRLEGSRMPDLFPEDTVADLEPLFRGAIDEGTTGSVETEYDGRDWKVWATPLRDAEGRIFAGLSFAQDVTEQRQREKELRLFKEMIEQAKDSILVTEAAPLDDPGPRIVYANPAFERMTGYDREELEGKTPRILQGPETDRDVLDTLRDALEAGERWTGETINYRKDGTPYYLRWSIAPVRNEEGQIEYWMSVQRDVTEWRAQEELLRRQKALLEQTQRLAGAWEVDLRTDEISWSEEVYRIHELPPGTEMKRGDGFEFYPPEVRPRIRAAFERCARDGEPYDLELPLVTAKGNRCWVRTVAGPVEGEDGEIVKVAGAFQDITERKEAERELERKNDLFTKAQEIAQVGAWEYDVQADALTWTEQVYRIHGLSQEEPLTPEKAISFYHPDDRPTIRSVFARALEDGESYDEELRIVRADGEERWVRTSGEPQTTDDGKIARVRGTIQDITERKEWAQALRTRQVKVEALYEAANRLLRADSREAVGRSIVQLIQETLGYPGVSVRLAQEGQLVPTHVSSEAEEFMPERPPLDIEGESAVAELYREGRTVSVEDVRDLDDPIDYGGARSAAGIPIGEYGVIGVTAPEVDAIDPFDLRLIEVLASYATAVFDRLDYEADLVDAKKEAEEASHLKSVMLANMSHEIRTPLTSVTGFAEILIEELEGEPAEFSERIYRSGERLMKTLDSVLELSKLEAGAYELEPEPVRLERVAEEAVDLLRAQAEEKGVALEIHRPEQPVEDHWNEGALDRIAENLLENAIKFTPEGGRVEVRVEGGGEQAVLEIEDTGVGISEEALPHIFEAFKQESEGLKREYEGTGLGLSIVKELTERLGGDIEVESAKEEGTCFTVQLPREGARKAG